jgi:RHS repeat-associated protein
MRYPRFISASRCLLIALGAVVTAALPSNSPRAGPSLTSSSPVSKPHAALARRNSTRAVEPRDFISDISDTNNDFQSAPLCREACFAATYAFTTVPYFTLDQPRSVTLSYNGDRAFPRPFVFVKVAPDYGAADIAEYWLEVSVSGSPRAFVNGDTKLVFEGSTNEVRLVGQFDAQDLNTNVVPMTITVTAKYTDGLTKVHTHNTQLMIVNERNSYFAKGWTLADVQRLYYTSANVYMIAEGDGSAVQFPTLGVHATDFSTLNYSGGIYTRTYADGSKAIFSGTGKLTSLVDILGRATTFSYDGSGRVTEIADPMASLSSTPRRYVFAYGSTGLSTITESGGPGTPRVTTIAIGTNGSIQSITDPDNLATSFSYDGSDRLSTFTDRRGAVTTLSYDTLTWKLAQVTLPQVPVDAGSGTTSLVNPTVTYAPWQSFGLPRAATSSSSPAPTNLTSDVQAEIVDPMNRHSYFRPDRWGQPVLDVDPAGRTTTIARWKFLPTTVTHPDGSIDNFAYDTTRALLTMSQPAGSAATYFHYRSTTGQVDSVYGPGAAPQGRRFNADNNITEIDYWGAGYETFAYDPLTKRVLTRTDGQLYVTGYRYDPVFGNTMQDSSAGNRKTLIVFDKHGRDSIISPPASSQIRLVYDQMNRVTAQYDGVNATPTTFTHDALFETDITDSNGNTYHTDYNALGWPTASCDPLQACSTARYDRTGLVTSATNRRGQQVSLTRDQLGRITAKTGTNVTSVNIAYSANDRDYVQWTAHERDSVFVTPGTSSIRARDSVIKRIGPYRFQIVHTAPLQIADTATTSITSNAPATFNPRRVFYSGAGRPDSIVAGFGPISFEYRQDGLLYKLTYPDGTSIQSAATALHGPRQTGYASNSLATDLKRDYHYQPAGTRVNQVTNPAGATNQQAYTFDLLGRLTARETRTGCSLSSDDFFTNDGSGIGYSCPTLQATESFTYDAVGNRTDHSAVVGAANRYQSFDEASVVHDADGNVIQRYDPSRFNRQYAWSADGLLTSVTQDGWSTVTYEYNADGQPVIKRRGDPNGNYVDAYYIWDGDQLLAELDGNGNRRSDYVYMPGSIDQPIAQTLGATSPTTMRFHQLDGLGNVIGTFQSGALSQSVAYDSWGVPSLQGNADNRLLWKGLLWEGDIVSLYYMRNRWYDPDLGRFISEDPLEHDGGLNLYAFSGNDPVNGQDPSGLCDVNPIAWIDFVMRSPGQGTYSLTCHDLPPVIITASTRGYSARASSDDVLRQIGELLRPFQGPAEGMANAVLFFGGGAEGQAAGRVGVASRQLKHIFVRKSGHVNPTTISSRGRYIALFERIANDNTNRTDAVLSAGRKSAGVQGYARIFTRGQVWVHVYGQEIVDAGVNRTGRFR